jgi:hypothetical protein
MVVRVAGTPELGEAQTFLVDLVAVGEVEDSPLAAAAVIVAAAAVHGLVNKQEVVVVHTIVELVNQIKWILEQVMGRLLLL